MNTKQLLTITGVILAGVICGLFVYTSLPKNNPAQPQQPAKEHIVSIVSAANFADGGNCHDHFIDGCDLYSAELNLLTGAVANVQRLTNNPAGDTFPQVGADGTTVTFTRYQSKTSFETILLNLVNGTEEKLDKNYLHLPASAHEPHVSADGNKIVYYDLSNADERNSGTAQAKVFFVDSGKVANLSEADGSAHCFWSFDGGTAYCNNRRQGGIIARTVSDDGLIGSPNIGIAFPSLSALAAVDSAFTDTDCVSSSVEYGSFCDATHVALTASCMMQTADGLDQKFTHAILEDLSTSTITPIGAEMATAFNGLGSHSWTTGCGPILAVTEPQP